MWSKFKSKYWEKLSFTTKTNPVRDSSISQKEMLSIITHGGELYRQGGQVPIRMYIENDSILDMGPYLPIPSDQTLEGYHKRVQNLIGGRKFFLTWNQIHQWSPLVFEKSRKFFSTLYSQVGFPPQFADVMIFMGDYEKTPFGVHVDYAANFTFPVLGEKRLRVWSEEYAKKSSDLKGSLQYENHLPASTLLASPPKGMIYMPSTAYHIGEPSGAFTVSYSFVFGMRLSPMSRLFAEVNKIISSKYPSISNDEMMSGEYEDPSKGIKRLPKEWKDPIRHMKRMLQTGELEEALRESWANMVTSCGFQFDIAPDWGNEILDSSKVSGSKFNPVAWKKTASGNLLVSFRGESHEFPYHSGMIALLKFVNSGRVSSVSDLARRYSGVRKVSGEAIPLPPEFIVQFIHELVRFGALNISYE
jgi:hypothetical protein